VQAVFVTEVLPEGTSFLLLGNVSIAVSAGVQAVFVTEVLQKAM
jgi:hypothetical protein